MINLIVLNLIVGASALLIVKHFFIFEHTYDYFITLFVIYFAQIVLSTQLLGILGALYLKNLFFLNVLILFAACLISWRAGISKKDGFVVRFQDTIARLQLEWTERLLLSIIFGFALVKIAINLKNPPFGWDSLNYHFTFAVEWIKNHGLDNPIVAFCDPAPTYYPINGSLFYLWFMLPLKNVFIADIGQAPFFVLGFMAVYALSRKLCLPRRYALFSAAIFTLVPNYFKQLEIAYVDVMVAAMFLCALNYLFLLKKETSSSGAILAGICIGLMIGIKATALPLALLPGILLVYFWLTRIKKKVLVITLGILFIVFTGGFSYIRNYIQTGNFLYPLNLELFGVRIFKGVIDAAVYRTAVMAGDYSLVKILFSEGLGAQAVILMAPAVLLGMWHIFKKEKKYSFDIKYFLLLPVLMILVFRFVLPLANLRYIYALLGICSVAAFFIAQKMNFSLKLIKSLVIICAVASIFEISNHRYLVISLLSSAIVFVILPNMRNLLIRLKVQHIVVAAVVLFFASLSLQEDYVENEYKRYIATARMTGFWPEATYAWDWFNANTQDSNVAYAGRPVPFPLYGSNFKNNVYYISVNDQEPAKLHNFANSKYIWGASGESKHASFLKDENYRGKADYWAWKDNLSRRDIDFLFVYSLHHTKDIVFPIEDQWAQGHQELFDPVYRNNTIHIYKLIK